MINYKLGTPKALDFNQINHVIKTENGKQYSIPFDPANTDYANFKKEVLAGAELQDADGNTMTTEEATEFIATLP
jgi:hypothetical protein